MPASPWASQAQIDFLSSRRVDFATHQTSKRLPEFWPVLHRDFFALWPDKEAEYDSWTDKEKKSLLSTAKMSSEEWVAARKKGIYNWLNNHGLNKGRRSGKIKTVKIAMPQTATCLSTEAHLYSKKYYDSRVKHLVEAEIGDKKVKKSERLAILNKHLTECFKNETPEIQNEIKQAREEERRAQEAVKDCDRSIHDAIEELTIGQLLAAQSSLPDVMADFCEVMGKRTGWCFAMLAGGPDAGNEGEIATVGCHTGQDKFGHTFRRAYSQYEANVATPFNQHLHHVFPKSVREKYKSAGTISTTTPLATPTETAAVAKPENSSTEAAKPESPSTEAAKPEISPSPDDTVTKNADLLSAEKEGRSADIALATKTDVPPAVTHGAVLSDNTLNLNTKVTENDNNAQSLKDVPCQSPPLPINPVAVGKENVPPTISMPMDTAAVNQFFPQQSRHHSSLANSELQHGSLHLPQYESDGTYTSVFYNDTAYLPAPYNASNDPLLENMDFSMPMSNGSNTFTNLLADASGNMMNFDRGMNMGTHPIFDQWTMQNMAMRSSLGGQLMNNTPGPQNIPSISIQQTEQMWAPSHFHAPALAPGFAHTLAPASVPALAPASAPAVAPTLAPASSPALAPASGPALAPASGPALAPASGPALAPVSAPAIAPTLAPASAPAPAFSPSVAAPAPVPTVGAEAAPVQGAKNSPAPNVPEEEAVSGVRQRKPAKSKEIMPLIHSETPLTEAPQWYTAAYTYLQVGMSSKVWSEILELWVQFEEKNGLFDPGSGSLRLPAKLCPARLSKWMLDRRTYDDVPDIDDIPGFQAEWVAWWNGMQPKWRQAQGDGLPLPMSVRKSGDSLASLKKAGPVGIVMVLVGLKWWAGNEKRKEWLASVADVNKTLNALLDIGGKRKGGPESLETVTAKKRKR